MARSRNIKPSFFTSDALADISPLGRLLFIGLWTVADREGRLEDRPRRIKAEVLPYDNVNVDKMLESLQNAGFINRYEVDGERYIQVTNFTKHQNPHMKEAASTIPAPCEHGASMVQEQEKHDTSPADSLNPLIDSLNRIPDSLDTDANAPKPTTAKRKSQIPEDFGVTDALEAWGAKQDPPFTVADMQAEVPTFVDHYRANGNKMLDWHATFQNWMRRNRKWAQERATKTRPAKTEYLDTNELLERARKMREADERVRIA